jgi:hypothetical protein
VFPSARIAGEICRVDIARLLPGRDLGRQVADLPIELGGALGTGPLTAVDERLILLLPVQVDDGEPLALSARVKHPSRACLAGGSRVVLVEAALKHEVDPFDGSDAVGIAP